MPQELLRKIDSAIYVADKARSTAAKARTAGYVLLGITLLNLVGTAVLLRRRQPVAAAAPGGAPAASAQAATLFADLRGIIDRRRHARLLRRQQALARAIADLSATFSLYQDQAKEVDAVMGTIRDKLTRLDAEIRSTPETA